MAQLAADPAAEFEALLAQHDLLWTTDGQVTAEGIERRLSLCADLVAVAGHDPRSEKPVLAHQVHAAALIEVGDPAGLTELARHCELAEALGTLRGRWWSASRRAVLAAIDGRVEEALGMTSQARQLGTLTGEPDATGCDQSLRCSLSLLGINPGDQRIDPPVDRLRQRLQSPTGQGPSTGPSVPLPTTDWGSSRRKRVWDDARQAAGVSLSGRRAGRLFNLPIAAGTGAAAATRRHRRKPFRRFDVTVGAPTSARPGIA